MIENTTNNLLKNKELLANLLEKKSSSSDEEEMFLISNINKFTDQLDFISNLNSLGTNILLFLFQ